MTCIGDERCYSYLKTLWGSGHDKAALAVLDSIESKKKVFDFLERGSDERQYNSPGVDLGIEYCHDLNWMNMQSIIRRMMIM